MLSGYKFLIFWAVYNWCDSYYFAGESLVPVSVYIGSDKQRVMLVQAMLCYLVINF